MDGDKQPTPSTPADAATAFNLASSEEEEEEWSDRDEYGNDYEYFEIEEEGEEAEFDGFLEEGEGSNTDLEMMEEEEEEEMDPDDMSYEELIALGDLIGREKRGLSLDQISAPGCLRRRKFLEMLMGEVDRCVICQAEYGGGEEDEDVWEIVGCGHPYHKNCITSWLLLKKSCPICAYEPQPQPPSSSFPLTNNVKDGNVENYNGGDILNGGVGGCAASGGGGLCNDMNDST